MTVDERKEESAILTKIARMIGAGMTVPEFAPGGVPVRVAAAVYGKSPAYIGEGIRAGWLPIGHMKPGEQRDSFYISPLKLYQDTGFVYTGQTPEQVKDMIKKKGA